MDKEKNHLVSGTEVPKLHQMKKQDCLDCLVSKNQVVDCVMSAIELKALVNKNIKENIPIEATCTATPAQSDLNPIVSWLRPESKEILDDSTA